MPGKQQEPRSNNNGGAAAGGDEAATTSGVWSTSREVYWSQVQLCMTAFFALLCFVPFFRPSPYAYKGDDYYIVSPAFNNNTFTVSSFLAPLMVAILPFCDMVLDQVPASLFFLQEQELPRVIQKKEMVRLTDVERSMFILGIVFVSTAAYPPVQQSSNEAALYYAFENASAVLTICPIVAFLCRTSTTFTPAVTTLVSALVCVSVFLSTIVTMLPRGAVDTQRLGTASAVFMDVAAACFFLVACVSLCRFLLQEPPPARLTQRERQDVNDARFRSFVVGTHMATTLAELILNGVWYWYSGRLTPRQLGSLQYFFTALAVVVFLVELRVRKNEVLRALRRLVGSVDKYYIRYISHELRTPLNCAFLGLKVLRTKFESADTPADRTALEMLVDVDQSCAAALDVLNDLLSVDKLENGLLEMHKEATPLLPFLADSMRLFHQEAREHDTRLLFINGASPARLPPAAAAAPPAAAVSGVGMVGAVGTEFSLLPHDIAAVDRVKITQVLRNLMSNALKFTDAGGTVTVYAAFVPGVEPGKTLPRVDDEADGAGAGPPTLQQRLLRGAGIVLHHLFGVDDDVVDGDAEGGGPRRVPSAYDTIRVRDGAFDEAGVDLTEAAVVVGTLRITVQDDGVGISRANLGRLFKEVVQFSPERLRAGGGSGYGLCLVKGIVDLHGGGVAAASDGLGRGATFTVELPMERPLGMHARQVRQIREAATAAASSARAAAASQADGDAAPRRHSGSPSVSSTPSTPRSGVLYTFPRSVPGHGQGPARSPKKDVAPAGEVGAGEYDRARRLAHLMTRQSAADLEEERTGSGASPKHKAPAAPPSPAQSEPRPPPAQPGRGLHVLLVDDDGKSRQMMARYLTILGYKCDEAEDGLQAIEKVRAKTAGRLGDPAAAYAVIVMDFVMPRMDGSAATRQLRELGYTAPIVGLTGNVLASDKDYFMKRGLDRVLMKPLDPRAFNAVMEDIHQANGRRGSTEAPVAAAAALSPTRAAPGEKGPERRESESMASVDRYLQDRSTHLLALPASANANANVNGSATAVTEKPVSAAGVMAGTEQDDPDMLAALGAMDAPANTATTGGTGPGVGVGTQGMIEAASASRHRLPWISQIPKPLLNSSAVSVMRLPRPTTPSRSASADAGAAGDEESDDRRAVNDSPSYQESIEYVVEHRNPIELLRGTDLRLKPALKQPREAAAPLPTTEPPPPPAAAAAGSAAAAPAPRTSAGGGGRAGGGGGGGARGSRRSPERAGSSNHSSRDDSPSADAAAAAGTGADALVVAPHTRPTAPPTAPGRRSCEMLVVDDSRRNRRVLMRTLQLAGYTCDEADDGQTAVDKVRQRLAAAAAGAADAYDAVLMDIIMPTKDGDVAAREIRAMGYTGAIVGMTGSPDSADHARFLAAGGNKVMLKPLELVLLDRALANLLSPAAIAARTDALRALAAPAPAPPPAPRAPAPAAAPSASAGVSGASPAAAAPPSRPYELLIVDDSPRDCHFVARALAGVGFVCEEARDGQAAVDALERRISQVNQGRARMYDAVLMDLVMPRLDGAGAAGELRERGYEGAIVGATGRADEEARRAFLDAGGSQVLVKPLDLEALRGGLLACIAQTQASPWHR